MNLSASQPYSPSSPARLVGGEGAGDAYGRRFEKKVSVNNTVTKHLRFFYRGYLQIASRDMLAGTWKHFLLWDPTQGEATRPLALVKGNAWYCYGWDLTKNVCEAFGSDGIAKASYDYAPFGEATSAGDLVQPFQWSSEYCDAELGLVYYNFRHYNPRDGRWISRDPIGERGGRNLYCYVEGSPYYETDRLGLDVSIYYCSPALGFHWKICVTRWQPTRIKKSDSKTCCFKGKTYEKSDEDYCIGFGPIEAKVFYSSSSIKKDSKTNGLYNRTPLPPEMKMPNFPKANGIVSENMGEDYASYGMQPSHLSDLKTNCDEDMMIYEYMKGQVGQTAYYHPFCFRSNCQWYAYFAFVYIAKKHYNSCKGKEQINTNFIKYSIT